MCLQIQGKDRWIWILLYSKYPCFVAKSLSLTKNKFSTINEKTTEASSITVITTIWTGVPLKLLLSLREEKEYFCYDSDFTLILDNASIRQNRKEKRIYKSNYISEFHFPSIKWRKYYLLYDFINLLSTQKECMKVSEEAMKPAGPGVGLNGFASSHRHFLAVWPYVGIWPLWAPTSPSQSW